ncbi:MAG: hypothetical protein E7295_03330 [Lachnospiraceae bacterium]|jgi:cytoskeletal protein RodZ|nr:hypothetical protein [Lachnospiraceae bacterium]
MNHKNDIQEKEILAGEAQAKKSKKKKKQNGPGHLKERNHFDGKDMILLVVMLIIIYGIMTWVEFFAQEKMNSLEKNPTQVTEISQTNESETIQTTTTVENP